MRSGPVGRHRERLVGRAPRSGAPHDRPCHDLHCVQPWCRRRSDGAVRDRRPAGRPAGLPAQPVAGRARCRAGRRDPRHREGCARGCQHAHHDAGRSGPACLPGRQLLPARCLGNRDHVGRRQLPVPLERPAPAAVHLEPPRGARRHAGLRESPDPLHHGRPRLRQGVAVRPADLAPERGAVAPGARHRRCLGRPRALARAPAQDGPVPARLHPRGDDELGHHALHGAQRAQQLFPCGPVARHRARVGDRALHVAQRLVRRHHGALAVDPRRSRLEHQQHRQPALGQQPGDRLGVLQPIRLEAQWHLARTARVHAVARHEGADDQCRGGCRRPAGQPEFAYGSMDGRGHG